ncbi:MAG: aminotransferase class V-fold PLP-dependent enzyme, partial [Leucobacter sp.]
MQPGPDGRPSAPAYLDHASTSPMPEEVLDAYARALRIVGNPASTHGHGQRAGEALEEARERIAGRLGCDAAELVLTGGGTESVNLALKGVYWARRRAGSGPVLLVADGEHHATIEAAEWLRDAQGARVRWLPIEADGRLLPETLAAAISEEGPESVALVSFLWANNEVGTVQPVEELCRIAAAAGIPAHVDAVSALGQLPVDFRASGAAALSVSAHKIGGPVGVGGLVLGRRTAAEPLLHGGAQQ